MKILKNIKKLEKAAKISKQKKEEEKTSMFFKLINILAIAHLILSLLSLSLYKNNIIRNKTNLLLNEKTMS
jgi:membrane-anchored glycerophosphoryl diester phosphodiesterase (GDPDase)